MLSSTCKYAYMQHMYDVYAAHLKNFWLENHLSRLVSTPVGLTDLCEDDDLNHFYDNCFDSTTSSSPASALGSRPELGRFGSQDQMLFEDLVITIVVVNDDGCDGDCTKYDEDNNGW